MHLQAQDHASWPSRSATSRMGDRAAALEQQKREKMQDLENAVRCHREPRAHLQAADSEPEDARAHHGGQPRLPRGDPRAEGRREARAMPALRAAVEQEQRKGEPTVPRVRGARGPCRRAASAAAAPRSEDEGVRLVDRPRRRPRTPPAAPFARTRRASAVGLDAAVWGDAARAAHRAAGGGGDAVARTRATASCGRRCHDARAT